MSLRDWLRNKIFYELDIKGIAVALAFLLSVSVFAGGREDRNVHEDRHPPSTSGQSNQAPTRPEKVEPPANAHNEAYHSDMSRRAHASLTPQAVHHAVTP